MCVHISTCVWEPQVNVTCFPQLLCTCFFPLKGLLLNMGFTDPAKLYGQQASGTVLSLNPQCWNYRHPTVVSSFTNLGPCLASTLSMESLPRLAFDHFWSQILLLPLHSSSFKVSSRSCFLVSVTRVAQSSPDLSPSLCASVCYANSVSHAMGYPQDCV